MYRFNMWAATFSMVWILAGCLRYVEETTPPGQVTLPIPSMKGVSYSEATPPQPYRSATLQTPTSAQPSDSEVKSLTKPIALFENSIIPYFDRAYRSKKSPRLAVFLNRSLSDEVLEWVTSERAVMSISGSYRTTDGSVSTMTSGIGESSTYTQTYLENFRRVSPGEGWMWEFEDGFLQPFLEISANVVDRATIMRLAAQQSGQQDGPYFPISVKKIEMDALTGKADFVIELLVRKNPSAFTGYEFKATAKEVNTGIIRAMVTSIGWNYSSQPVEKVVVDNTGYHFVTETPKVLPEVNVIARDLALALMRALGTNWNN